VTRSIIAGEPVPLNEEGEAVAPPGVLLRRVIARDGEEAAGEGEVWWLGDGFIRLLSAVATELVVGVGEGVLEEDGDTETEPNELGEVEVAVTALLRGASTSIS